jgi:hypothetical protein
VAGGRFGIGGDRFVLQAGEIVVLVGACGEPADVARVGMGAAPAMSTNAVSCALL